MILLAHILGLPVEEALAPLASGAGTGAVIWLATTLAILTRALR
jgi:hypothetical protein